MVPIIAAVGLSSADSGSCSTVEHTRGVGNSYVICRGMLTSVCSSCSKMFALLAMTMLDDVNTINTWAEPHNANGITPNTVIDSNDEPPQNNQQRTRPRAAVSLQQAA